MLTTSNGYKIKFAILRLELKRAIKAADKSTKIAQKLEHNIKILEDTHSPESRLRIAKMIIKQNGGSYFCDTINNGHSLKPIYIDLTVRRVVKLLSDEQKEYTSMQYTCGSFSKDKKNWKVIRYIFNTAKGK